MAAEAFQREHDVLYRIGLHGNYSEVCKRQDGSSLDRSQLNATPAVQGAVWDFCLLFIHCHVQSAGNNHEQL